MHVDDERTVEDQLRVHATKLTGQRLTDVRCAYMMHALLDRTTPLSADFIKYTRDELVAATKAHHDKRSVQWLLKQVSTYDAAREVVAGVFFVDGETLAHVFLLPVEEDAPRACALLLR